MLKGGWELTKFEEVNLPQKAASAFSIVSELEGATYKPVYYCGEQLVSGKNYMILCEVTYANQEQTKALVKLVINEELEGKCTIVETKTLVKE